MLALLSWVATTFRNWFWQKEILSDRQVLYAYTPGARLFPFCTFTGKHSGFVLDLFAGLLERDKEGHFLGDLAESWVATPDKKVWRFTLRSKACWSNGEPIIAEDFVRSIKFLLEHKLLCQTRYERIEHQFPLTHLREVIEGKLAADTLGIYAEDERTLSFHLTYAMEERVMLAVVNDMTFFPIYRDYLDASNLSFLLQSDIKSIKESPLITSGPFLISKQRVRNGVALAKNPYYWNHQNVILERIIHYFSLPDDLTQIDLFRFQFGYLKDFPSWLNQFRENLHIFAPYCPYLIFFNLKHPVLSSKNVRRAIQHLVVFEENEYFPYLSLEPFLPNELRKVMQFEKRLNPLLMLSAEQRVEKARQLLKQEGFSEETPLAVIISHIETCSRLTFRDMLLERFKTIPFINLSFQFLEQERVAVHGISQQFQLYADRWRMPIECPLFTLLTQAGNQMQQFTGFENERYTELCRQLLSDASMDRQEKVYKELFEILYEEVPYVTLGYFFVAVYHQSHVGGLKGARAHKQSLPVLPRTKTLYRLKTKKPRSKQRQLAFEAMLNDGLRCQG